MPGLGLPLLAPPPLLTGRSIPVRGERRGEERSCNREVAGEELSPAWGPTPPLPPTSPSSRRRPREREREAALTWEREGMIQLLIFGPMGELYFKALD